MYVEVLTRKNTSKVINIEVKQNPMYRAKICDELIERFGLTGFNKKYKQTSLYCKGEKIKDNIYLIYRKDQIYSAVFNKKDIQGALNMLKYHLYNGSLIFEVTKYELKDGIYINNKYI